jgi:hypothetical protein
MPENQPDYWFSFDLCTEQVWNGFHLLAHQQDVLTLPHDELQKDQFTEAMKAWNLHIQQAGQEEYRHACKKCV